MKKKLTAAGVWFAKWTIAPIGAVIFIPVLLSGAICSAFWTSFLAGWKLVK